MVGLGEIAILKSRTVLLLMQVPRPLRLAGLSSDKWFHSPLSNRNWEGEKKQWYVLLAGISKLSHLKNKTDYRNKNN